ncbi:hypothetical protein [Methylobacterium segetis]|uniref:hypothetical protein n=1 Tax=Methylobacterium segetis TaxID=2488750 RepID=UPI00104EB56E|nr:hypothetical protein [Methylobacterium segetis]
MKTARKGTTDVQQPGLRERAKAARASASRLTLRDDRVTASPDPILAAIERHAAAAAAFRDSTIAADQTWVAKHGGDTSPEAMAKAEAAWEAADLVQIEAWNALFETRPTTSEGLVALLRHVGEYADTMLDTGGTYTAASIFDVLADHAAALSDKLPGHQPCAASKLGELLKQAWREHDLLEEAMTSSGREALRPLEEINLRQIQEMELAISYVTASSPVGMLTQLAIAFDAVDTAANGASPDICSSGQERAERCLHSIAAALCAMTGVARESGCAGRYLPTRLDHLFFFLSEVA